MKSALYFVVILLALTLSSNSCEKEAECPDEIICSMVFASISVDVVDSHGEQIELTRAQVTSKHLDNPIDPLAQSPQGGPYKIVDDSHMSYLSKNKPRKFKFEGWIGNELVVSETYSIRHDCCHVQLEEGRKKVVVQ